MKLQLTWICLAFSRKLDAFHGVWLLQFTYFSWLQSLWSFRDVFYAILLAHLLKWHIYIFINPFWRPKLPLWLILLFELPCTIEFITTTILLVHSLFPLIFVLCVVTVENQFFIVWYCWWILVIELTDLQHMYKELSS
jgi:hypothetical protein